MGQRSDILKEYFLYSHKMRKMYGLSLLPTLLSCRIITIDLLLDLVLVDV